MSCRSSRFEKLWFFDETPSLLEIVASLWSGGDVALAALVALVSIVLPVLKMIGVAAESMAAGSTGSLFHRNVAPHLSKWSMMDVLLVAIVIAAAKTTGLRMRLRSPAFGVTRPQQ